MSKLFYHTMQDNAGNLLFGVSGTMRLAGTGTLANIYGDPGLSVLIPNPMTNHPSYGSFKCYLGQGAYDFYMAKAGYSFETLTGLEGGGSLSNQDASDVTITGGSIALTETLEVGGATGLYGPVGIGGVSPSGGTPILRVYGATQLDGDVTGTALSLTGTLQAGGATGLYGSVGIGGAPSGGVPLLHVYGASTVDGALTVGGNGSLAGVMGLGGGAPNGAIGLFLLHPKASRYGLIMQATGTDVGNEGVMFQNMAGSFVGSINYSATETSYNTTSDARLKHAIAPLTGALDVVQALRPVSFLWNADGSPGRGFLASEVQEVIPDGVITGERDAVDDAGGILPQMIDSSRLVPWLVGAVQTLAARVAVLEDALGV